MIFEFFQLINNWFSLFFWSFALKILKRHDYSTLSVFQLAHCQQLLHLYFHALIACQLVAMLCCDGMQAIDFVLESGGFPMRFARWRATHARTCSCRRPGRLISWRRGAMGKVTRCRTCVSSPTVPPPPTSAFVSCCCHLGQRGRIVPGATACQQEALDWLRTAALRQGRTGEKARNVNHCHPNAEDLRSLPLTREVAFLGVF